jgi:hypothetical protein
MRAGVHVDSIEMSRHMVDRMREKPDGHKVEVTIGDMSRATTGRSYGLVSLGREPPHARTWLSCGLS